MSQISQESSQDSQTPLKRKERDEDVEIESFKKLPLNTHENVQDPEACGWNLEQAINELVNNALDCDKKATLQKDGNVWQIINLVDPNTKTLNDESFIYKSNEEKRQKTDKTGKFGYGLKDALSVLANYNIQYVALSENGEFRLARDEKNRRLLVIERNRHGRISNNQVIQKFFSEGNNAKELDLACENIKKFSLLSDSLVVNSNQRIEVYDRDGTLKGEIFQRPVDRTPINFIFMNGMKYDFPKSLALYYNLYLPKLDTKSRDRDHLPRNYHNFIYLFIKTAPTSVHDYLINYMNSPFIKDTSYYEFTNENIKGVLSEYKTRIIKEKQENERLQKEIQMEQQDKKKKYEDKKKKAEIELAQLQENYEKTKKNDFLPDQAKKQEEDRLQGKIGERTRVIQKLEKKIHDIPTSEKTDPIQLVLQYDLGPPYQVDLKNHPLIELVPVKGKSVIQNHRFIEDYLQYPIEYEYVEMDKEKIDSKYFLQFRYCFHILRILGLEYRILRADQHTPPIPIVVSANDSEIRVRFDLLPSDMIGVWKFILVALAQSNELYPGSSIQESIIDLATRIALNVEPDPKKLFNSIRTSPYGLSIPKLSPYIRDTFIPLLVGDEWNTKKGGISTFNIQLANGLAELKITIYVLILGSVSKEEKESALKNGIQLFGLHEEKDETIKFYDYMEKIEEVIPPEVRVRISHVIGHAHITGPQSIRLTQLKTFSHAKFWMINHVVPQSVEILKESKSIKSGIIIGKEKTEKIAYLNNRADFVWSVGPVMFEEWNQYLSEEKRQKHAQIILPFNPIFKEIKKSPLFKKEVIHILIFGRADDLLYLKGFDIAVQSCSEVHKELINEKRRIQLRVRGAKENELEPTFEKILGLRPDKTMQVDLQPYADQTQLVKDLDWADIFLMPSRFEPFGLVALEALSCNVPVLASESSGFAQFILNIEKNVSSSSSFNGVSLNFAQYLVRTSLYKPRSSKSNIDDDPHLKDDIICWKEKILGLIQNEHLNNHLGLLKSHMLEYWKKNNPYKEMEKQGLLDLKSDLK